MWLLLGRGLSSNSDDLYDAMAKIDFVSDGKWIDDQESVVCVTRLAHEFWFVVEMCSMSAIAVSSTDKPGPSAFALASSNFRFTALGHRILNI